jgi:hypothetical protein
MTRKRQAVAHIPRFIILTTMENPADEEEATRCVIRECDKNGNLLNEVWGTV